MSDEMKRFEVGLREAFSQRDANNRAACIGALAAVVKFRLKEKPHWIEEQLHRPFVDLLSGLEDLNRGVTVSLLKPTNYGGVFAGATLFKMRQGYAVFAMELLVKQGQRVTAASTKVAGIWNKCADQHDYREAKTVKDWYNDRDKLHKEDPQLEALRNLRAIWDSENLDKTSADDARNMLRKSQLDDDLRMHLPSSEVQILTFLERCLSKTKPGANNDYS